MATWRPKGHKAKGACFHAVSPFSQTQNIWTIKRTHWRKMAMAMTNMTLFWEAHGAMRTTVKMIERRAAQTVQ
jgi:hypothetical protein